MNIDKPWLGFQQGPVPSFAESSETRLRAVQSVSDGDSITGSGDTYCSYCGGSHIWHILVQGRH